MTSYAELLQTCTEFQENFSLLNGKHHSILQALKLEQERAEKLSTKLEAAAVREEQQEEQIRNLKKELDASLSYKERYLAASVSLEHMKARLESARVSVTSTAVEHDQLVGQLREQIKDLLRRIDVTVDGTRMRELQKQVIELEERCAVQNGQLHEEREHFAQQLLVAHNALREQQGRNLELEQRYRTIDGELTEMRAAVRRSADLQNEAAIIKEKYATEAAIAQREVLGLREEVETLNRKLTEAAQAREDEVHALQRVITEAKHNLGARVGSLTNSLNDVTSTLSAERDKYVALQRTVQQQVEAARDEATSEVTALRQSLLQRHEDVQRLQWRCQELSGEVAQDRCTIKDAEKRNAALTEQMVDLQRQLSQAAQQEAWLAAEKGHVEGELAAVERKMEDLHHAVKDHERIRFEYERLQLKMRLQEEELAEGSRSIQVANSRLQDFEEAAEKRLRVVKHELRECKRHLKAERAASDMLRRKLVHTVAECESERRRCDYKLPCSMVDTAPQTLPHLVDPTAVTGCDVLSLLREQNERSEQLRTRLVEMAR